MMNCMDNQQLVVSCLSRRKLEKTRLMTRDNYKQSILRDNINDAPHGEIKKTKSNSRNSTLTGLRSNLTPFFGIY